MGEEYTSADASDGFTSEVWERDDFPGFEFITLPNGDPDPYAIVTGQVSDDPGGTLNTDYGTEAAQEQVSESLFIDNIGPLTNEQSAENLQAVSDKDIQSADEETRGTLDAWDVKGTEGTVTATDTSHIEEQLDQIAQTLSNIEIREQNMVIINQAQMGFMGMVLGAFIVFLFIGRMR